ncbi:MAG TPA: methionine adenosyltransferase [Bacillota bacterium]|jgi:S-adenosylmethionine synthetase|nr:methionine adenosyltransferase [Bacillota bacterium]
MNHNSRLFTSESVTEGHPDKLADQISDAILDAIIAEDPVARVAVETMVTTGMVFVCGEITTKCYVDIPRIIREKVKEIGYTRAKFGFDGDTCAVITSIDEQSPDIAMGVDSALEVKKMQSGDPFDRIGAGDQGIVVGYACDETEELMPLPITLAHRLAQRLAYVRKSGLLPYLRPDGKSQVTLAYEDGKPKRLETVVVSAQHSEEVSLEQIEKDITEKVIARAVPPELLAENTSILVNPTGRFVVGGPQGDTGLTGRKIMVDTYGSSALHGGGAFSGKDPTKVDRSGAYAARHVAKNIVAAGLARRCQVQVAYVIGVAQPVSINVETFGTETVPVERIEKLIRKHFDLRPAAIIERFDLRRPIYQPLAAYGHFGRPELDLPWEKLDRVQQLQEDAF